VHNPLCHHYKRVIMKKSLLFPVFFFFTFFQVAFGQTSETFVLKPGEDLFEKYYKDIFVYPEFKTGKVYYSNGDSAGGKMNYNRFLEVFEFIDNRRDTLIFAVDDKITYVNIQGDIYYYNKPGFLLCVPGTTTSCKLATKQSIQLKDVRKIGAFGLASNTSKIESLDQLRSEQTHRLVANEEIIFSKEKRYYFGNEKNFFLPANKKNVLKLLPSKKNEIEGYLMNHNIDFQNEEQLLDLLNFIKNLK
jgi:hypothetical protein